MGHRVRIGPQSSANSHEPSELLRSPTSGTDSLGPALLQCQYYFNKQLHCLCVEYSLLVLLPIRSAPADLSGLQLPGALAV